MLIVLLSLLCTSLLLLLCLSCSLAGAVALPACMHLRIIVHDNAYSVLRLMQSAGPAPPRHQHISALIS